MTFSLRGVSISNDGTGRVVVTDILNTDDKALICRSERTTSEQGDWFLHPTEMSTYAGDPDNDTDNGDRIVSPPHNGGWNRNRGTDSGHQLVRLKRITDTAEEGVFTCDIPGDDNTPRYLGVYYPSELY